MPHPATLHELRDALQAAGLRPQRRLGQHFLVDGNLLQILVREAQIDPDDVVLEVGTGPGNLTELLAAEAGHVVTVEVDPALADVARMRLAGHENVDLLVADVLRDKHHLDPEVLETVRARAEAAGGRLKLVANLPYAAATPLLVDLLIDGPVPRLFVFTVQEEVAERLAAAPGTKAYGPVTVLVQALAEVETLRRLPPSVFWPRPKVWSSMVRLWPSRARRRRIADLGLLRQVVEGLFGHRRKRAPKSLALAPLGEDVPEPWAARLRAIGLNPEARGETYPVEAVVELANRLASEPPGDA